MNNKNKRIAVRVSVAITMLLLVVVCALPAFAVESDFVEEAVNEATIKNYIYAGYYLYEYSSPLRHLMERSTFFSALTPYLYEFETAKVGKLFDETPFITYESMSGGLSDICIYSKTDKSFTVISDVYFKVHHTTQSGSKWVYFDIMNSTGAREQRIRFKLDQSTLELLSVDLSGDVSGAGSDFIIGVVSTQFDRLILDYGFSESFFKGSSIYWAQYQDGLKGGYYQGYMNGCDEGYNQGYNEGWELGYENGYTFSYDDGFEAGKGQGYETGYDEGYNVGSFDGYNSGHEVGYSAGKTTGYNDGYKKGETAGYESGYTDGYSKGNDDGVLTGKELGYDQGWREGRDVGVQQGEEWGLVEGYNNGYADGEEDGYFNGYNWGFSDAEKSIQSEDLGKNLLGDLFAAPFEALNKFTVVSWITESGNSIEITLGAVLSAIIGVSLFAWFLKLFAGG